MKQKFTLSLALTICAFFSSNAQVTKGDLLLGANLSYNSNKAGEPNVSKESFLLINPSISVAYKDNKTMGISLSYGHLKSDNENEVSSNSYGARAFLRQYHNLGKQFSFFLQESAGADLYKNKSLYSYPVAVQTIKTAKVSANLNPGFAYSINKHLQVEMLLLGDMISAGYVHTSTSFSGYAYNPTKADDFFVSTNGETNIAGAIGLGVKLVL